MEQTTKVHVGFDRLLSRSTSPSEKVATTAEREGVKTFGRLLEDLALAAPAGLSRAQLVARHSSGSVSKALDFLGEQGNRMVRVRKLAPGTSGGRRAERYLLGSLWWATLGIHVSIDDGQPVKITAALCDLAGDPVDPRRKDEYKRALDHLATGATEQPWVVLAAEIAALASEVLDLLEQTDPDRRILGLGIEVPGHVHDGVVLLGDHAGYGNTQPGPIRLAEAVADELIRRGREDLASRIVLENDVNLIAIREAYNLEKQLPAQGAVVAVFNQGVGAGILTERRQLLRGSHGAGGEPGHMPVFIAAGEPRPPQRPDETDLRLTHQRLIFDARCSCGGESHVDCYATPDRLLGELGVQDPRSFPEVARRPALSDAGTLTDEGRAFWKGGYALGLGLLSLITNVNPRPMLVLLPYPLAEPGVLGENGQGDGTAAGLYRQAIEHVISAHAMTTTADDARGDDATDGWRWLEVQSLSRDEEGGARKAARNAALGVRDVFIAHAAGRDACDDARLSDIVPDLPDRNLDSTSRRNLLGQVKRDLHDVLLRRDPEGLVAASSANTPKDEYGPEEAMLLALVTDEFSMITPESVIDIFSGFPNGKLGRDRVLLHELTQEVVDLQTVYNGRRYLRAVV